MLPGVTNVFNVKCLAVDMSIVNCNLGAVSQGWLLRNGQLQTVADTTQCVGLDSVNSAYVMPCQLANNITWQSDGSLAFQPASPLPLCLSAYAQSLSASASVCLASPNQLWLATCMAAPPSPPPVPPLPPPPVRRRALCRHLHALTASEHCTFPGSHRYRRCRRRHRRHRRQARHLRQMCVSWLHVSALYGALLTHPRSSLFVSATSQPASSSYAAHRNLRWR